MGDTAAMAEAIAAGLWRSDSQLVELRAARPSEDDGNGAKRDRSAQPLARLQSLTQVQDAAGHTEDRDQVERGRRNRGRDPAQASQVQPVRESVIEDAGSNRGGEAGRTDRDGKIGAAEDPRRRYQQEREDEGVRLLGDDHLRGRVGRRKPSPSDDRVHRAASDAGNGQEHADRATAPAGLVDHEEHPADSDQRQDHQSRRDTFTQEPGGEDQDQERLEGPEHHRQAGGDGRQAEQAQGVGETWIQDPQAPEDRRSGGVAKWLAPCAHEDREQQQTRAELYRQEAEGRDLSDGPLADDGSETPADGGEDQRQVVTASESKDRHGDAPRAGWRMAGRLTPKSPHSSSHREYPGTRRRPRRGDRFVSMVGVSLS